jgi:serine/threonine-protein kinase
MSGQLGKYRIDSVLGKGAMGVVYKAFDPYIERVVALKTIRKELFSDSQQEDLISRFKNEAQAAGRLNHPNIVMVYDYGEDSESAYIAMEFVEGTPLNTLILPGQPTALSRVNAWMSDLLLALEYAHSRGVVHRDIKPANLMITTTARVKVSDFGIARIDSSTLTQTGSMIGTPSYMSPEQFRGETVDGRSDVFSAGVLLYQLLSGVRPFVGSASAVMQQILNVKPPPPSQAFPALGTVYDRVVERATAKAPADRFATAREFLDALTAAARGGGDPDVTTLGDSDRTILTGGMHYVDPGPATSPPTTSGTGGTSPTVTPWKLEALPELETILVRQIGPMGRILLKKIAGRAEGMDELCRLLLPHIPSDVGRIQFQQAVDMLKRKLAASGTGSGIQSLHGATAISGAGASGIGTIDASGTGAGRTSMRAPAAFDDAWADAMAQRLTQRIGPIARVVAKRAAAQTRDKTEFLLLLAQHIESAQERARFLADTGMP